MSLRAWWLGVRAAELSQEADRPACATWHAGLLQNIDLGVRDCQALILAPTRELATQIVKVVVAIGDYLGVTTMVRLSRPPPSHQPPRTPQPSTGVRPYSQSRLPAAVTAPSWSRIASRVSAAAPVAAVQFTASSDLCMCRCPQACIGGTNVRQDMEKLRAGVQLVVGE